MSADNTSLMHDPRVVMLSNRTINALRGAGIRSWSQLATEASRKPNCIRGIDKLGPKGVKEIILVLNTAQVDHTIRSNGARGSATPRH